MSIADYPFRAAERPAPRLRPFQALGHFRKLVANKEDTAQVFHMADCLPSGQAVAQSQAFCSSPLAERLMYEEPSLPELLDDHETLLMYPRGSLAQAYVAFMRSEGLSAAGLVAESEKAGRPRHADQWQWLQDRLRDTHDLMHVLTGYGRDALGEQCVLGFSCAQYHDWTDWIIAWVGGLEFKSKVRLSLPVMGAIAQSQRHGAAARPIYQEDIRALLREPLEQARARLNIATPSQYTMIHSRLRARGIDPYKLFLADAAA